VARKLKNNGFSLTEVLMAVGILSIGLMLVATMFPAALYLTTVASERTMAAIVADGAFAKIKLYGLTGTPSSNIEDYNDFTSMNSVEFSYPSADPAGGVSQYYWSALCRQTDPLNPSEYLVTVFVSRKTNPAHTYLDGADGGDRPCAVRIDVSVQADPTELGILNDKERYINPPTTIIDNATGKIYRVIDRKIDDPNIVVLDRGWEDTPLSPDSIWLVPPPNSGGQNADIEVFQEIIRF
jgi:prepilin-type N-terminal cleavage/methylation domain-containing protein